MQTSSVSTHTPWNKGKLIGQKLPLKLHKIWAIRIRLQLGKKVRGLALLNLAIYSKLRGCDLVKLKVSDISHGSSMLKRAMITQQKTKQPVQFEITGQTKQAVVALITHQSLRFDKFQSSLSHCCPINFSYETQLTRISYNSFRWITSEQTQ